MKYFYLIAAMCCTLCAQAQTQDEYELRTLTFEGEEWASLIDYPQYGGKLLYGEDGSGEGLDEESYIWKDSETLLSNNGLAEMWGMRAYFGGGHAVSNYGTKNFEKYNSFSSQLTVYNSEGTDEITRSGNGHNGSDNFVMHYGYHDNSEYSTPIEQLPALTFTDGVARVIDHMWVNNSCYALSCYLEGNGLTAKIGPDDWVKIVAIGYNGTAETGTAEVYLCEGPDNIVKEWTKFDLSKLGEVTKVLFNVTGSSDNGAGFSQPAYFAYDDVAVRFPKSSGIENITVTEEADDVYYDLMGRRVNNPSKGIYIHNGKKVYIR